jgi:hypothetical protein
VIIGLSGYAQSGKDTVADYLVKQHGFTKVSFADPIRQALILLDPKVTIADMQGVPLSTAVAGLGWENVKVDSPDVRGLMQRMGTEVGRQLFGENFWVNQAMAKAAEYPRVVFADVRFENEAKSILEASGAVWRVSANGHISETSLDNYSFTKEVNNIGSLEDLYETVDYLISH